MTNLIKRRDPGRNQHPFLQWMGVPYDEEMVRFVVPSLTCDVPRGMYVTSALARSSDNPHIRGLYDSAVSFFQRVDHYLGLARTGDLAAGRKARAMLGVPEAPEVGFGYTVQGWRGNGLGEGSLGDELYDLMLRYPVLSEACAVEPDALSFVPGFGLDRISDIIVTVGKRHLIDYTLEEAAIYGFSEKRFEEKPVRGIWNSETETHERRVVRLPVRPSGEPVLLIPGSIVRSTMLVHPHQYARFFYGGQYRKMTKLEILEDASSTHGNRLLELIRFVLAHPHWCRPRWEYRQP